MQIQRRAGRPPAEVALMPMREIARKLGITERATRRILSRATKKLSDLGAYEGFIKLATIAQSAKPEDFYPVIKCASIECRPEKQY